MKDAYEIARFKGQVASPSLSYKTVQRRFKSSDTVFFYDTSRYESDIEAKYSPVGSYMVLTKIDYKH